MLATALLLLTLAADPPLFNGKNLDGWEVIGDSQWTVMADGTLVGQRTAICESSSFRAARSKRRPSSPAG